MRAFFDNCTSPTLAATIDGFVRHRAHGAVHIRDLPCGRHATDIEWIQYLASTGDDWLVITGDGRIQKNRAERLAFRQAGLRGFVLAPAYQKTPLHHQASFLLWRWLDVEDLIRLTAAPFLFELPMSRTSQIRALSL